jgi:hypothetical protein
MYDDRYMGYPVSKISSTYMPLKYVSHHENITPDFVSGDPLG